MKSAQKSHAVRPLPAVGKSHVRKGLIWLLGVVFVFLGGYPAGASLTPSQVMILVNKDTDISSKVADMYQRLRGIPKENVLRLSLGTERQITPEQYWKQTATPVKQYLEANPAIKCILTTSGVPYTVMGTDGKDEGAAFDNELATVLREKEQNQERRQPNPLYENGLNPYGVSDPRKLMMIYVARLDGPNLAVITRMVEDAVAVEKTGLDGPVFGDAEGLDAVTSYGEGDAAIRAAIDRLSSAGFEATLDMNQASWTQPANGVGNQAAGAAFYVGWYNLLNFQNIFGPHGLARGAIAWHIASQEAQNLWDPKGKGWCMNLMLHGAAVTLGPVREPYVSAFPHGDIFVEHLLQGASVAESYWLSLPNVSWAMVLLGDPLYSPFSVKAKPSLVARGYVAENATHVLEKGQTSGLTVELECVGPPGSNTPALTGVAEAGFGLAGASGLISVPALKAGESAEIHVPSITAGGDPNGMFRLNLNVRSSAEGEAARQIVVEGRIGFSRLTGGLLPKTQLFISPDGKSLISGLPGVSGLIHIDNLRVQMITPPKGFGLIDAAFSPDSEHIALTLVDPQEKKGFVVITNNLLGDAKPVPDGYQFGRWLDAANVLLRGKEGETIHPLASGTDRPVDIPEGWGGTVIPGTDTQMLVSKDGHMAIKQGSQAVQEVLTGTGVIRFEAAADDLSQFGGVDANKRLWVQSGLKATPEIVSDRVDDVLWGPISHRAVVRSVGGESRLFDGGDRSWTDLGMIAKAQWSPDEKRLLIWDPESASDGFLSLVDGKEVKHLCPLSRIGPIGGAAFSNDGQHAFLLAGLTGGMNVWMIALPPRTPSQ